MPLPVCRHLEHLPVTHDVLVGQLPATGDSDLLMGFTALSPALLNLLHHRVARNDVPEHDVLPVQPVRLGGGDEELAPIGAGAAVCHGEDPGTCVGQLEVLVSKLGPEY